MKGMNFRESLYGTLIVSIMIFRVHENSTSGCARMRNFETHREIKMIE